MTDGTNQTRRTYLMALGAGAAAGLAGCVGGNGNGNGNGNGSGNGGDGGADEIDYWLFGGTPQERDFIEDHYDNFDDFDVNYTHQAWGQKFEQVASAAGTDTLPHLIQGQGILVPDYDAVGAVQPIDHDRWEDDLEEIYDGLIPEMVEAMQYEGRQYGLPGPYADMGPFIDINPNMMEEAGFDEPPREWDELVEYAVEMQQLSGVDAGIALPATDEELTANNFEGFAYQNGGRYFDPDTLETTVNGPGFVGALELWEELVVEGVLPDGQVELNYIDAGRMFMAENTGMFVTLSHAPAILATIDPPEMFQDAQNQIVTLAPEPSSPDGQFEPVDALIQNAMAWMLADGAQSEAEQDAALAYMKWWHEMDQLESWSYQDGTDVGIRGRLPTFEEPWENPSDLFRQQYDDLIELQQQGQLFATTEVFPSFPGLASIQSELIRNAIQPVILGNATAQEALDDIAPSVQETIDENLG
ncbi:ABC transporter substrate-binding protein [Natrarchaeobius sp. A-rgal3]|uniref:ABC transporter substrate-binding protein n=1 Tax=Natrarchaeobius versutus TaxID=1679078 RepID=UPI00350F2A8F